MKDNQVLKFIFVGVINTIFGAGVMFCLYNFFGCGYYFSSTMNYILGSILSYVLNKYFTFGNKNKSVSQILKFVLNIILCYAVAYRFTRPFMNLILSGYTKTIRDNISMIVGMCLFTVTNYFGQKLFVFKDTKQNIK